MKRRRMRRMWRKRRRERGEERQEDATEEAAEETDQEEGGVLGEVIKQDAGVEDEGGFYRFPNDMVNVCVLVIAMVSVEPSCVVDVVGVVVITVELVSNAIA